MWAAEPSISIHVSPIKDPSWFGNQIDVAVRNISTHDIRLPYDKSRKAELSGFTVSLVNGPSSKMTKYYWELNGRRAPRKAISDPDKAILVVSNPLSVSVKPGKTIRYYSLLNDLYGMNSSGTYAVQIKKVDPVTNLIVESNIVSVTAVQARNH